MGYKCQGCSHVMGYHKDRKEYWGNCLIIECECKEFIWAEEDYKKYSLNHGKVSE